MVSRNMKIIALVMACFQVFSCASGGSQYDAYMLLPSHDFNLKAIGQHAKWQQGKRVSKLKNSKLSMTLDFHQTDVNGLVFAISVENLSSNQIKIVAKDFSCRSINVNKKNKDYPILEKSEITKNYDKTLKAIQSSHSSSISEITIAIGITAALLILLVILAKTHSGQSLRFSNFHSNNTKPYKESSENKDKLKKQLQDAEKKISTLKKQYQKELFKSTLIRAGDKTLGKIICPFAALGDKGLSLIYQDTVFEFAGINGN